MILLTGATGFIGARLRTSLARHDDLVAVTRPRGSEQAPAAGWLEIDLANPDRSRLPATIDTIVYSAQSRRYREVPGGCSDMVAINVAGLLTLVDAGMARGLQRVIYLSTGSVYPRSTHALTESDAVAPDSFYAQSKRFAELALETCGATLDCVALRLFTVYGEGQRDMLITNLFGRLDRGEPTRVGADGGPLLSPLYVDDVCSAVDAVLVSPIVPRYRVFNVGGPEIVTMQQLAVRAGHAAGRQPLVFDVDTSQDPGGWATTSDAFRREYGWTPATSLDAGLARVATSRVTSAIHAGEMH